MIGVINPILKKSGNPLDPSSFRGITLLSCIGKLFTSILNKRLVAFGDSLDILNENQAGFRKGYSTVDHIFTLKCIVDLFLAKRKPLYCCFVDFFRAYDGINREALWYKLIKMVLEEGFLTLSKHCITILKVMYFTTGINPKLLLHPSV